MPLLQPKDSAARDVAALRSVEDPNSDDRSRFKFFMLCSLRPIHSSSTKQINHGEGRRWILFPRNEYVLFRIIQLTSY